MKLPGVYVTVEDRSVVYQTPSDLGRTGYVVIVGNKGPHNQVIKVNSISEFIDYFGKPNYDTTGYGHYLAVKFLQYYNPLYVVRAAVTDSYNLNNNSSIANLAVYQPTNTEILTLGNCTAFTSTNAYFINKADIIKSYGVGSVDAEKLSKYILITSTDVTDDGGLPKICHDLNNVVYVADTLSDLYIRRNGDSKTYKVKKQVAKIYQNIVDATGVDHLIKDTTPANIQTVYSYFVFNDKLSKSLLDTNTTYSIRGEIVEGETNYITYLTTEATAPLYKTQGVPIVLTNDGNENVTFDSFFRFTDHYLIEIEEYIQTGYSGYNGYYDSNSSRLIADNTLIVTVSQTDGIFDKHDLGLKFVTNEDKPNNTICKVVNVGDSVADKNFKGTNFLFFQKGSKTVTFWKANITTITQSLIGLTTGEIGVDADSSETSLKTGDVIHIVGDTLSETESGKHDQYFEIQHRNDTYVDGTHRIYTLTLDRNWEYDTQSVGLTSSNFEVVNSYVGITVPNITRFRDMNHIAETALYTFYAKGAGSYYNSIFISGDINTELEQMYTDSQFKPLYKNLFMDIYVNRVKSDGSVEVLEGPLTCSLVDKLPDGTELVNIYSGSKLFIENVLEDSKYVYCKTKLSNAALALLLNDTNDAETKNKQTVLRGNLIRQFYYDPTGINPPANPVLQLDNGKDGIGIRHNPFSLNSELLGIVNLAYQGTLVSEDNSIQNLNQTLYPTYKINYCICGGYTSDTVSRAIEFVDARGDCLLISDLGKPKTNATDDIDTRLSGLIGYSSYNTTVTTQYCNMFDDYTGKTINMTPVYFLLNAHLITDKQYSYAEPVAGIVKTSLSGISKIAYKPTFEELERMLDVQINPIIVEPSGTYFLTQFTAYKKMSILQYVHAIKVIHIIKQELPDLLKPYLQFRMTSYQLLSAKSIVDNYMSKFIDESSRFYAFSTYSADLSYNEDRGEMNVVIRVRVVRVIQYININIIVT